MDLYALIDHCTLDASPRMETVLHQLVVTTSQGSPWHIFDMTDQKTYDPVSHTQAMAMTQALLEAGHDLRVGMTWHDPTRTLEQGFTLAQSFDPCAALAITSEQLGTLTATNQRARLARYLDPSGGEALLGFVDQILSQPAIHVQLQVEQGKLWPGRVYTVSAQQSLTGVLVQQPQAAPVAAGGHAVLLPAPKKQTAARPVKWTQEGIPEAAEKQHAEQEAQPVVSSTPSASARPNKAAPSGRRLPQPPVTKERLPLSTKTNEEGQP